MMTTKGYWGIIQSDSTLTHHGVLGMKWGVRRYRNKDGSLTPAGKRHEARINKRYAKKQSHLEADKKDLERISSGLTNRKGTKTIMSSDQVKDAIRGIESQQKRLETKRQEAINTLGAHHETIGKRDVRRAMALGENYVTKRTIEVGLKTTATVAPFTMYMAAVKASRQGKTGKAITYATLNAGLKTVAVSALYGHLKANREVREAQQHFNND